LIVETAWLTRIYVLFFISLWARCDFGPDGTPPLRDRYRQGRTRAAHLLPELALHTLLVRRM